MLKNSGPRKPMTRPAFRQVRFCAFVSLSDHWFPNPFWAPQSGQSQVIPLQVTPQKFSSMQSWHMAKPQRQRQQNSGRSPQQWQGISRCFCFFSLYEDTFFFVSTPPSFRLSAFGLSFTTIHDKTRKEKETFKTKTIFSPGQAGKI